MRSEHESQRQNDHLELSLKYFDSFPELNLQMFLIKSYSSPLNNLTRFARNKWKKNFLSLIYLFNKYFFKFASF